MWWWCPLTFGFFTVAQPPDTSRWGGGCLVDSWGVLVERDLATDDVSANQTTKQEQPMHKPLHQPVASPWFQHNKFCYPSDKHLTSIQYLQLSSIIMWVKQCHVYHPPVITMFIGFYRWYGYHSQSWVVNIVFPHEWWWDNIGLFGYLIVIYMDLMGRQNNNHLVYGIVLPSGKLTELWKITMLFMGKSTISMALFYPQFSSSA